MDDSKKLYDSLKDQGYSDLGEFSDFENKLKDSGKREILYNALQRDGFSDIGSLDEFNTRLGYPLHSESETPNNTAKRGGFLDTYLGDVLEKVNAGAADMFAGGFGVLDKGAKGLESITGGLLKSGGAFKQISDYFRKDAEISRANSNRYNRKSYSDLWNEGDYSGAIGDIVLQGAESLPMSIAAIASGPATGLVGMGAITANDKYDQLDVENPHMKELPKIINSLLTGTAEALSEKLGAGATKLWMKSLYKALGKEAAEKAVRTGVMGMVKENFKKYGILYESLAEGLEEVSSQLAENITDKITGADLQKNLSDGLFDSFVYGTGGGAYFSAAGIPGLAKRQHDKIKTRKDYNNAKDVFYTEFEGDDKMLGIGSELESATPEEKVAFLEALESDTKFTEKQKDALFNLVQSNIAYKSLRDLKAVEEEKNERRELLIQTEMMNYDNAISPITAENGMIQQVYINGDKKSPVYIIKGNVSANQNENGELLFDPGKSDKSLYYMDADGNTQVISPSQVTGIGSLSSIEDSRAQYEAGLRYQLDMQEQISKQQQEQEIENGDDIIYLDNKGKQTTGRVVDGFSNPEYVFLEDGTSVPRELISKAPTQTEQVMKDNSDIKDDNTLQDERRNEEGVVERRNGTAEELPNKTLNQIRESLPKKKNGDIDYKAMTPMQQYEYTSMVESPDIALSDLKSDIELKEGEISKLNDRVNKTSGGERAAIRDEIRQRNAELKELQLFYSSVNSHPEQIQPIPQTDNSTETILQETDMQPAGEIKGRQIESSASDIPLNEDGNPIYHKASIEDTISDLARDFDNEEIDEFIKLNRNEVQKQLNRLKSKKPKVGTNKSQYLANKKIWQEQVDDLQVQIKYWGDVENAVKESRELPGDKAAEEIKFTGGPLSGEELTAMMLANGSLRLTQDSYEKETGAGKEESKKMFGLFASPANGGVNIERAGELLMLADLENGTNFFDQNDPNAGRNAIIDVLSSARTRGDLINYIKTNREAMAERERQAEYNEYAAWCEENYHLPPKDYEAYEQDMRKQAESVTDEAIEYINGEIADEIQFTKEDRRERDAILAQNKESNEKVERNDEGGTVGLPEGGDQLLQDEQFVQTGRTGELKTEYTGANNSISIPDGTAQESASGEIKPTEKIDNTKTSFEMMRNVASEQKTKREISDAEQEVDVNPTEAQKEAGNYKKGHVKIDGFDITIEQPAGSVRSGKDAGGKEWSVIMRNTYGYIRGTEGIDGDHIDIFLSDSPSSGNVYIVDQVNADGFFDEHKVMYGFNSEEDAKNAYLSNYSPEWEGLGAVTEVSKDEFKKWIDSSKRKTKPFTNYKIAKKTEEEDGRIRFRKSTKVSKEESLIEQSKADGTYMKAPNGKPTNLNEKQWVQVRSKMFKKWFGDWEDNPKKSSKVLDKNGEPLVMFHGTLTNGLRKFKKEFVGSRYSYDEKGFFFISNEKIAQEYAVSEYDSTQKGEVIPVFINLRNPLVVDAKWCKKNGLGSRVFEDNDVIEFWDNYQTLMIEESENKDGVIVTDGKYIMTVAFEPNQIKSATDNNGNYSFFDDDIRFREVKNDEAISFGKKYNLDEKDVLSYADAMKRGSLGGAAIAFKNIQRTVRLANNELSLGQFVKMFSPIKAELYERFGDVDVLREEHIQKSLEACNAMEVARKRAEEEAEAERKRLEEFELMSDESLDSAYFAAVDANNENRMRDIVNEAARRKGYLSTDEFRMAHRAPSYDEQGIDKSMMDVANNKDLIRDSLNEQLRMNRDTNRDESAKAISNALNAINKGEKPTVTIYRAVPKSLREGKVRNGDWVTLSESYAKQHGNHALDGNYRIMKEEVPAENLYWDSNDINEWGYDDKSDYRYKNVKNNRKLNDLITRDDKGNIIPPSKRFNSRKSDPHFREKSNIDSVNNQFNKRLEELDRDRNQKDRILHLGTASKFLIAGGLSDSAIVMEFDKFVRKSGESYKNKHPFEAKDIIDLPKALNDPIAIFNSKNGKDKVILTELRSGDNNFIVAIKTTKQNRKGGVVLEIHEIATLFPKDARGIIDWINSGLVTNLNKEKALHWIEALPTHPGTPITNEELSSATKIVESFVNPTLDEGKISSAVEELSESLNALVRIIRDVNEITDEDKSLQRQKRGSKGWYDTKTGEVYLILPNTESVADAQATILHEVVAHKGLRGLLGNNFSSTMEAVFDSLPSEVQDSLINEFNDKIVSGEEYCARMAETMSDPGIIQRICSVLKEALRKIGVDLKMTDGDIMYMLWKSKNRLEKSDTAMESMNKILRDQNVKRQIDEYDTLFRSSKPINHLPVSVEKKIDIVNDLQSRSERLYEGYVDRMIAVKKLQDLISKKTGKAIPDYMNVWMYENTLSSRNTYEISQFKEKYLNPMTVALKKIVAVGLDERDIDTYVLAKHGLERNEYMRMKSVKEYIDNLKEDDIKEDLQRQVEGKTFSELSSIPNEDLQNLVAKLTGKDYSGLTAIQKELKDQSIEDFISEIESEFKPEIGDLWKRIKAVNDFSLKKWFDSGMINRASYEKIKGMYKNYVPLRGFDETMAHDVYEYYTTEGNPFNNPLKSAGGRPSRANTPFPHLVSIAESSIVGGNKNLMKLHLFRLAQHDMASENPSGKLSVTKQWYVYEGLNEDGVEIWKPSAPKYSDDIEQYRENIERHAEEMALLEAEKKATRNPSKLRIAYILLPAEANEHVIGVKLNGEFYQILVHGNPKVAQAVEGLNDEARTNNKFIKAVAWANRQMAANFTTRNPAFVVSNLTRDLIWSATALSVKESSKYRNKFVRNIPKASGALMRKVRGKQDLNNPVDVMLNEFLKNGGRTGYTALYSIEKYKNDIQNSIKTGKWAKTKRGYNAVLDFMQLPNEWAEDLSRFSTYMTSREEGRTILQSVSDAKEVTVNFNRKGSGKYGAGVFRGLFLFFNAAVQSLNNAYGLTLKNPRGMAVALGGFSIAGTIIPLILSMLGSDDERDKYNGLPDYVRKNNLCIPLGWCGVEGFLKIPLPIELRAFYGIGDAVYRALTGEDEVSDAFWDVSLGLLDLLPLNPVGGSSNFAPDAFKPLFESYATNKDFTGKPIAKITPFNEYDPEYQRVYRSTSIIPVKVSEYLNILAGGDEAIRKFETHKTPSGADVFNPAAIEHLFESYLGGAFTTLNQSFKTFIGAPADLNDFSWRNVPVLNRFYDTGDVDGTMMKVNEKYFDYLDEMKEAKNVYRKYENMADNSPALESAKYLDKLSKYEEGKEWKRAEFITFYAEQISDYMEEIKESTDEKRKDELQKEINRLKKEMVNGLKNGRIPN